MTRPMFLRRESVSDECHQNSDDCHERCGNVQPFTARNPLTAHDVWTDVANREQDRQVHADRCQSRKPGQDSDCKWSLQLWYRKVTRAHSRASPILCGWAVTCWTKTGAHPGEPICPRFRISDLAANHGMNHPDGIVLVFFPQLPHSQKNFSPTTTPAPNYEPDPLRKR